jgi:hypothetical protein
MLSYPFFRSKYKEFFPERIKNPKLALCFLKSVLVGGKVKLYQRR